MLTPFLCCVLLCACCACIEMRDELDIACLCALSLRHQHATHKRSCICEHAVLRQSCIPDSSAPAPRCACSSCCCPCADPSIPQTWEHGDLKEVGSQACSLSTGQCLRIGIARALYTRAQIIFLDDPFASLDATTASYLMSFLTNYICHVEQRLVILTTHSVHLLSNCLIIVLANGQEINRGVFAHLSANCSAFQGLMAKVKVIAGVREETAIVEQTAGEGQEEDGMEAKQTGKRCRCLLYDVM